MCSTWPTSLLKCSHLLERDCQCGKRFLPSAVRWLLIISGNSHLHMLNPKLQINKAKCSDHSPMSCKCKITDTSGLGRNQQPQGPGNALLQAKVINQGTKSTLAMPPFDNIVILVGRRFIAFLIRTDLKESHEPRSHGPLLFGKLGISADRSLFVQHIASVFPHMHPSCLPARTSPGMLWPCQFSEF